MVKKSFVCKFREKFRKNKQEYDTAGGTYTSNYDVKIDFTMPEFSASKIINQRFHVDNEEEDMKIGITGFRTPRSYRRYPNARV
jgi:hypothetical protein